jgi:hypothetical protein
MEYVPFVIAPWFLDQLRNFFFLECKVGETFTIICKTNLLPCFGIKFLILLTNLACFYSASRIMHAPNPNAKHSQPSIHHVNTCFHTHLKKPSLNHGLKISVASRVPLISEKPYTYSPLLRPIDIRFDILSPGGLSSPNKVQIVQTSPALQRPFEELSYTWGDRGRLRRIDPYEKQKQFLYITQNLESAL